jgi:hypothetical protein
VRRTLGLERAGTNTSIAATETSVSDTYDVLWGQWVSPPMTSAGTLTGGMSITIAASQSVAAALFGRALTVRVVSNDGATVRGVYCVAQGSANIGVTPQANSTTVSTYTEVACLLGDRLVVESGFRALNTSTTSYTGTLRYGGTAGDIESGDTANVTTHSPYVPFTSPAVRRLFLGQTLTAVSTGTSEAFGTAAVALPPTLNLGPSSVTSAQALGTPTVVAEAFVVFPEQFGGETFGVASVSNNILLTTGVASEESVPNPTRVIRTGDVFPSSIDSAEAHGATTLVYIQYIVLPEGIESAEAFGATEVEDPNRTIRPFGIPSVEEFGIPGGRSRLRAYSIPSAESFGFRKLTVKRGRWRLVQPTRIERHRLGGPTNVIYVTNVIGQTVYGTGSVLRTQENPRADDLASAQYVWQGGRDNITEDQAIRDLWLANGYSVEMTY